MAMWWEGKVVEGNGKIVEMTKSWRWESGGDDKVVKMTTWWR